MDRFVVRSVVDPIEKEKLSYVVWDCLRKKYISGSLSSSQKVCLDNALSDLIMDKKIEIRRYVIKRYTPSPNFFAIWDNVLCGFVPGFGSQNHDEILAELYAIDNGRTSVESGRYDESGNFHSRR
jgi:hypothetical protein